MRTLSDIEFAHLASLDQSIRLVCKPDFVHISNYCRDNLNNDNPEIDVRIHDARRHPDNTCTYVYRCQPIDSKLVFFVDLSFPLNY